MQSSVEIVRSESERRGWVIYSALLAFLRLPNSAGLRTVLTLAALGAVAVALADGHRRAGIRSRPPCTGRCRADRRERCTSSRPTRPVPTFPGLGCAGSLPPGAEYRCRWHSCAEEANRKMDGV